MEENFYVEYNCCCKNNRYVTLLSFDLKTSKYKLKFMKLFVNEVSGQSGTKVLENSIIICKYLNVLFA